MVHDPSTYTATPQIHSKGLGIREPAPVPVVPLVKNCRSCGEDDDLLGDCPVLYYNDTNNNHNVEWVDSTIGRKWAAVGFSTWQEPFQGTYFQGSTYFQGMKRESSTTHPVRNLS